MPVTLVSMPTRHTQGGEPELDWWVATRDGTPVVEIHDAATCDRRGVNENAAGERRAREQRWACEWWPPD